MVGKAYTLLACQIRQIRMQIEEWPRNDAKQGQVHRLENNYEDMYKTTQWRAHKWHHEHNAIAEAEERNSGLALRRARPLLPTRVYRARRRHTRAANRWRHLSGQPNPSSVETDAAGEIEKADVNMQAKMEAGEKFEQNTGKTSNQEFDWRDFDKFFGAKPDENMQAKKEADETVTEQVTNEKVQTVAEQATVEEFVGVKNRQAKKEAGETVAEQATKEKFEQNKTSKQEFDWRDFDKDTYNEMNAGIKGRGLLMILCGALAWSVAMARSLAIEVLPTSQVQHTEHGEGQVLVTMDMDWWREWTDRETFDQVDINGDGLIDLQEHLQGFLLFGQKHEEEGQRIFEEFDDNGDGFMDIADFIDYLDAREEEELDEESGDEREPDDEESGYVRVPEAK